jgi:hypothetical protein
MELLVVSTCRYPPHHLEAMTGIMRAGDALAGSGPVDRLQLYTLSVPPQPRRRLHRMVETTPNNRVEAPEPPHQVEALPKLPGEALPTGCGPGCQSSLRPARPVERFLAQYWHRTSSMRPHRPALPPFRGYILADLGALDARFQRWDDRLGKVGFPPSP